MLSEVPAEWRKARIDEVLQRNTASVSVTELAAEGLVAHYSLPAFDANKKPVIESGSEIKSNKTAIDEDCLLFSKLNPRIPRVWRVRHSGEYKPVCSTEFWALTPKTDEVSLSYAEYFLGWNDFLSHPSIKPASSTNSHQRVDRKAFDAFPIPLPPSNEQHRIAEILSSVDESIQATQAVIEQAERVKRGLMGELLTGGLGSEAIERGEVPEGWRATTIGAICEIARGGSPRPIDKFMTDAEDGINWIKIGDASASSKYIYTTKEKIKPEGEKKSRRVRSGDFLLSNSMSFGRPYILRTDGCIHDGWLSLSFDRKKLGEEFLYYLLSSPLVFNQFSNKAAGSAVKNLNKDLVSSVSIALPPYEQQKRIEKILGDIDALIDSQQAFTEQQNRMKRGLMNDLLTGKVRTV